MASDHNREEEEDAHLEDWRFPPLDRFTVTLQALSDQIRDVRLRRLASPDDLRAILALRRVDLDLGETVLALKHVVSSEEAGQADRILKVPSFVVFARSQESRCYLLQGNAPVGRHTHVSGTSLFSKRLYDALSVAHESRIRPLIYFCGNHMFESDPSIGSVGLLRCLILQLLDRRSFKTDEITDYVDFDKLKDGNLHSLCRTFVLLAKQMAGNETLFCIIDGVEYWRRSRFELGLYYAIDFLLGLAEDHRTTACVKVLVTSVVPSESIASHPNYLSGLNVLNVADFGSERLPYSESSWGVRVAQAFGL